MTTIIIARDFSKLPGPRHVVEGPNSGEDFRDRILRPKFEQAQRAHQKLVIDLDGVTFGYPTSFLEESFGGLARALGIQTVLDGLTFKSTEEPMLPQEIERYIRNADKTSRERANA